MLPPAEPLRRFSLAGGELAGAAAAFAARGFALIDGLPLGLEALDALRLEAFSLSEERLAARDGRCVLETLPPPQPPEVRSERRAFAAARSAPPLRSDVARLLLDGPLREVACACFAAAEAAAAEAAAAAGGAPAAPAGHVAAVADAAAAAAAAAAAPASGACFLLNEQYIVKPGGGGSSSSEGSTAFGWHADGEGLPEGAPECLSIWIALDDATAANGCLEVALRAGSGASASTSSSPSTLLLELPTGCAVVLSHALPHRSGPNTTAHDRRAWMPQFSRAPVLAAGGAPLAFAVPLQPP
jgi:hypothetical protein